MRVELGLRVESDLQEIGDYIARDNPERALSFVEELEAEIRGLGENPYGYRLRTELGSGLRMAVYGRYLILFRIVNEVVWAERVLHGSRNLKKLLS